ncbi:MAG: Na+/Pi-cotransporter [Geobacteraceae bacterium]|nr:Na+/Pi-cotransporter [Geobacteraceae bacterium]
MSFLMLLEALGGLGLFILGMKTMSEGLQRLAGERLRRSLETLAGNRFSAAFLGSCLTSLLQSSGAASIIIIGLVNAGLLSLYQALGMLVGTSLGTTFVVQLIAFRISFIAAPGILIGAILKFFSKRRKRVHLGEVLLGISLLFFGLNVMEANFSPLKESAVFSVYQAYFPSWHIVEVFLGAALTFFVQSGSAAIGIIIALASSGLLQFEPAVAMVTGEVLGTVWLAAIGAISGTMDAKRTVLIYFIMALILLTIVLLFFPFYFQLVNFFSPYGAGTGTPAHGPVSSMLPLYPQSDISRSIANAHTIFSVFGVILLLPLISFFARSASKILPGFEKDIDMEPRLKYIDFRVTNTPVIAFSQARNEVRRMAEMSRSMFCDVVRMFEEYDARRASSIKQKENVLDALQKDISNFLVVLARQPLTPEISVGVPIMLQTVNGLEDIGDCSEMIHEFLKRKKEANVYFSDAAMGEIRVLAAKVGEMLELLAKVFDGPERQIFDNACSIQKSVRELREKLRTNHTVRLSSGACTVIAGLLYMDIVSAFERIGELSQEIITNQRGAI